MLALKLYTDVVRTKIQSNFKQLKLHGVICFDPRYVFYENEEMLRTMQFCKVDTCSDVMEKLVERECLSEIGYMFCDTDNVILEIFRKNNKQTHIAKVKRLCKIPAIFDWKILK